MQNIEKDVLSDINGGRTVIARKEHSRNFSVGLYCGPGASEAGVANIKRNLHLSAGIIPVELTGQDISEIDLSVFDVLIFPGGKSKDQSEGLGSRGKENVQKFVHDGGGYLGICAGLYTAITGLTWSLNLLNAKSIVAKEEWKRGEGYPDIEVTKEGALILGEIIETFKCRYNNGPLVEPGEDPSLPAYMIAAYFRSEVSENGTPVGIMVDTPAAAYAEYGSGRVFVTGVHPENTPGLEHFISRVSAWLARV